MVARSAYDYLRLMWTQASDNDESEERDGDMEYVPLVEISSGESPALRVREDALRDRDTAHHVIALWAIANRGNIDLTVESSHDDWSLGLRRRDP